MITGDYDITQEGITYSMSLEMTRLLKQFCMNDNKATVAEWYVTLNHGDKKNVTRAGDIADNSEPFFADPIYD